MLFIYFHITFYCTNIFSLPVNSFILKGTKYIAILIEALNVLNHSMYEDLTFHTIFILPCFQCEISWDVLNTYTFLLVILF